MTIELAGGAENLHLLSVTIVFFIFCFYFIIFLAKWIIIKALADRVLFCLFLNCPLIWYNIAWFSFKIFILLKEITLCKFQVENRLEPRFFLYLYISCFVFYLNSYLVYFKSYYLNFFNKTWFHMKNMFRNFNCSIVKRFFFLKYFFFFGDKLSNVTIAEWGYLNFFVVNLYLVTFEFWH